MRTGAAAAAASPRTSLEMKHCYRAAPAHQLWPAAGTAAAPQDAFGSRPFHTACCSLKALVQTPTYNNAQYRTHPKSKLSGYMIASHKPFTLRQAQAAAAACRQGCRSLAVPHPQHLSRRSCALHDVEASACCVSNRGHWLSRGLWWIPEDHCWVAGQCALSVLAVVAADAHEALHAAARQQEKTHEYILYVRHSAVTTKAWPSRAWYD